MTTLTKHLIKTSVTSCTNQICESVSSVASLPRVKQVALPVGMREIPLSEEAAQRLSKMAEDPTIEGKVGRRMETVDASELFE